VGTSAPFYVAAALVVPALGMLLLRVRNGT
jgi:hypothetical protein